MVTFIQTGDDNFKSLPSVSVFKTLGSTFRASLTTPNVALKEDLDDPIRNLVAHYKGDSEAAKRQTLTADSVGQDLRGLRSLIRGGCLRAAVNLTSRLLHMYNQGYGQGSSISKHSPKSLQVRIKRIKLLKQTRSLQVDTYRFGSLGLPCWLNSGSFPSQRSKWNPLATWTDPICITNFIRISIHSWRFCNFNG